MLSNSKDEKITQNISNVTGSVNAQNITGDNNNVTINQGDINITVNKLTISDSQLEGIEKEYVPHLKEFLEKFNITLNENKIEPEKISDLQTDLNGFVEELKDATPTSGISKKESIRSKFFSLAKKSVKYLPKAAQLITSFTPLAPLSPFIGEAGKIIEALQQES